MINQGCFIPKQDRRNAGRLLALTIFTALVFSAHFLVATQTHPQHVVHIFLRGLLLLPIIAASVWFGLAGGLASSLTIAIAYGLHIAISWPDRPMENANQIAMIGIFLAVGLVSGWLVRGQELERRRRLESERAARRNTVIQGLASLSEALGYRDSYTKFHSANVADLAVALGRARGLPEDRIETLRLSALVHDVGKIGVRDDILLKPKQLTPEERHHIERHPEVAAEILRPLEGTEMIAETVLTHHECLDGTGYPRGLKKDQIPLEAMILAVADTFSALTEDRPYHKADSVESALETVHSWAGTKLDVRSVNDLRDLIRTGSLPK